MKNNTLESGDFIFRENDKGALEFVGDFNGLYSANDDPWSQSGRKLEWSPYYNFSRARITNELKKYSGNRNVLEVGCGLGFVVKFPAFLISEGLFLKHLIVFGLIYLTLNHFHNIIYF